MANLAVSTMVIDPTNPSFMYAGTGEVVGSQSTRGAGIFKSTDGGLTWNRLAGTDSAGALLCLDPATCPWLYVNRLAISPNGSTILAATKNGIWQSTNGGTSWNPTGTTGNFSDVDFHPTNSQRAIASGTGAAFFSTNAGQTWTAANFSPGISGRVEVAYAPNTPTILYASVDQNNGEVYRSTDGESINGVQNYTRVNTGTNFFLISGPPPSSQGNYDNIIWVNPRDSTFVIVGGIDLWRSTDSGSSFTKISQWQSAPASSAHADHHMVVAHPGFNNTTNRTAFFGNDGGIYRADNVATVMQTSGWTQLNNNLGITQFYGAAGNFIDFLGTATARISSGAQDNGTQEYIGGTNWGIARSGDGGYCAADPAEQYYYGEYVYLTIHRSINGSAYLDIYNGIEDANNAAAANFVAPFILDPNNPNTMLAGGVSLWRTTSVKTLPIWSRIWGPTGDNSPISAIAVSPGVSDVICVGHNNGDIYYTSNGTANNPTWFKIDRANLPNRMVTRLVIDFRLTSTVIYATFGGFSPGNVFRTTDNGTTWVDITGSGPTGLPYVPVRTLVYHPVNRDLLYVGTEIGIFNSDDGGATWDVTQGGPANVSVDELFWMGSDLIAVTHGRGLYRASSGVYVDCNYNGAQLGTLDQPFKTVAAAVNALTTYQPIWIKPCTYIEPMTITKRLELRSFGGPVIIRGN